jgi:nicotinic acid mononucleotide adenylyltransferase
MKKDYSCFTPLDVFEENYAKRDESKSSVVLVTTGSMNPIHLGHVAQLEKAKEYLEKQGKEVVAGFVSPSDAGWAKGKAHGCLNNEKKIELCMQALEGHPFIRVDQCNSCCFVCSWTPFFEGEIENGMIDYPAVISHLKETFKDKKVAVLYVCGEDHAKKCGLFFRKYCVVIGRPGYRSTFKQYECCYIPHDRDEKDISSTSIRKAIEKNDLTPVKHMLHPKVS